MTSVKFTVFCDVMPYRMVEIYRSCGVTYLLRPQSRRIKLQTGGRGHAFLRNGTKDYQTPRCHIALDSNLLILQKVHNAIGIKTKIYKNHMHDQNQFREK